MVNAKAKDPSKVGGIIFLLSIFALSALVALLGYSLLLLPLPDDLWSQLATFGSALLIGGVTAVLLIRGRLSIFVHELKHSILSNLVGNKAKRLKVAHGSGSFEYSYSRQTAHMNAFIALAPYCLPLTTTLTLVVGVIFLRDQQTFLALILAAALGADLVLNFRDAGPHQTDFSELVGGFVLGFYYTLLTNFLFFLLVLTFHLGQLELLRNLLFFVFELLRDLSRIVVSA